MGVNVRRIEYFHVTMPGDADEAFAVLARLAEQGVNLVAMHAVPLGPESTQFTLFPDDAARFQTVAKAAALAFEGPHPALLVQGDDEIGMVARLHGQLEREGIPTYASTGVSDGRGGFGYVLHVRAELVERALTLLRAGRGA